MHRCATWRNFPGGPAVLAAFHPHRTVTRSLRAPVHPAPLPVAPGARRRRRRHGRTTGVAVRRRRAAEGLTMEARALLDGHARIGSWMAIDVHITNAGPAVVGELRLAGGVQGKTRFGTPVDLPTQSDKTYRLYAQPPAFGRELTIDLVEGSSTVASTKTAFAVHDAQQLVVGDRGRASRRDRRRDGPAAQPEPGRAADGGARRSPTCRNGSRRGARSTASSGRTPTRPCCPPSSSIALRGWVAGGGRLVIVGGTSGPSSLSAFPDTILPFRPTATTDVAPASLAALLGEVPADARDLPALSGEHARRALAGDQRRPGHRRGARLRQRRRDHRRLRPDRRLDRRDERRRGPVAATPARPVNGGPVVGDDSQIVSAASQLPTLALPPIGGLIALLGAYILLIGPINYLVLKRLDKREWAWVTMPALIVVFAVGAYGFGSLLRGSEVIVNEVAIVRGAPGATEGTAQAYLGVFSPSRGTYQVRVPGGALLSAPVSGDFFGGDANSATLDILQGDPARIRDLGSGSARCGRSARRRPWTSRSSPSTCTSTTGDSRARSSTSRRWSCAPRRSSWAAPSRPWTTWRPARRPRSTWPLVAIQFGQQLSDRIVGPRDVRRSGTARRRRRPPVRPPRHHRPADLRPELRVHRAAAGRRTGRPGLGRRGPHRRRDRGPDPAPDRQRPVLPAGRAAGHGHDQVPAPTCCAPRSSRPTPTSSARTR